MTILKGLVARVMFAFVFALAFEDVLMGYGMHMGGVFGEEMRTKGWSVGSICSVYQADMSLAFIEKRSNLFRRKASY